MIFSFSACSKNNITNNSSNKTTDLFEYTKNVDESEYSKNDPSTFACVGESDGIADYRIMKARLDAMKKLGIDTEFHSYKGLHHGFGLGENTVADGWINSAVEFWEKQMKG